MLSAPSGSTPITRQFGAICLIAVLMPAIRPPPPTGTTTASRSASLAHQLETAGRRAECCDRALERVDGVAALGLDDPLHCREQRPGRRRPGRPRRRAPCSRRSAPDRRFLASPPWRSRRRRQAAHDTASAWLPALTAITPRRRASASSRSTCSSAARALKEPACWNSSSLIATCESGGRCARMRSEASAATGVATMRPASASAAASISRRLGAACSAAVSKNRLRLFARRSMY